MIYDTRIANLNTDLATLTALGTEYQELTSRSQSGISKKSQIQGKIQGLKAKISDIENATSTYEKEFIDRKQSSPTHKRFQTLQDIVLAAFFITYFLISVMAVLHLWRSNPTGGFMYAGSMAFVLCILGIVIAEMIRRYA